jgi:hypothetical protein
MGELELHVDSDVMSVDAAVPTTEDAERERGFPTTAENAPGVIDTTGVPQDTGTTACVSFACAADIWLLPAATQVIMPWVSTAATSGALDDQFADRVRSATVPFVNVAVA